MAFSMWDTTNEDDIHSTCGSCGCGPCVCACHDLEAYEAALAAEESAYVDECKAWDNTVYDEAWTRLDTYENVCEHGYTLDEPCTACEMETT